LTNGCGGTGGGSDPIGIELTATDLGGGSFIVRVTGRDFGSAAVQGISLEVQIENSGNEPIQYDAALSSIGPFFSGGHFAAAFGQEDPSVLFVGAGLLPELPSVDVNSPMDMLVLGFQMVGLQPGEEDTITFTLQKMSVFAKDPVGGFPVEVPPQSYLAQTSLTLPIVI